VNGKWNSTFPLSPVGEWKWKIPHAGQALNDGLVNCLFSGARGRLSSRPLRMNLGERGKHKFCFRFMAKPKSCSAHHAHRRQGF
jgi:hypothetical protein